MADRFSRGWGPSSNRRGACEPHPKARITQLTEALLPRPRLLARPSRIGAEPSGAKRQGRRHHRHRSSAPGRTDEGVRLPEPPAAGPVARLYTSRRNRRTSRQQRSYGPLGPLDGQRQPAAAQQNAQRHWRRQGVKGHGVLLGRAGTPGLRRELEVPRQGRRGQAAPALRDRAPQRHRCLEGCASSATRSRQVTTATPAELDSRPVRPTQRLGRHDARRKPLQYAQCVCGGNAAHRLKTDCHPQAPDQSPA